MMKKLLMVFAALAVLMALTPCPAAKAAGALDEIEVYRIMVDPESDASLYLTYHIEWKVLDDSSAGPLTWVKIGVPSQYVDNIQAQSDSIDNIYYYYENGEYVRIDLDREYYAGEIVTMDFSLRVSYMYVSDFDTDICSFYFTPGWFDEIEVKSLTILWNSDKVRYSDAASTGEDYLVWTASLLPGEKLCAYVEYDLDAFDTDYVGPPEVSMPYEETAYYPEYEYESNNDTGDIFSLLFLVLVLPVAIVIGIMRRRRGGDDDDYHGGFGGRFHGGGHCASSCACACGCACACACAGGGRAGCSAKNFYVVRVDKLKEALDKDIRQ